MFSDTVLYKYKLNKCFLFSITIYDKNGVDGGSKWRAGTREIEIIGWNLHG